MYEATRELFSPCKMKGKKGGKVEREPAAGLFLLIQHFNKSMPLEKYNPHPELS